MKYTIPQYRIDKMVKRLEKFNRKALKYKALPIIYSVSKPYTITVKRERNKAMIPDLIDVEVTVVDLEIDVESFQPVKGYKFLASIEHTENGNIFHKVTHDIDVPEKYHDRGTYCDHCKTNRFRCNTFIVYNTKKKDFIQVGSTCIKDYLGINLDLVAKRFEFLEIFSALSNRDVDGYYERAVPTWPIERVLAVAINTIELDGCYVSGKMAYESGGKKIATSQHVSTVLDGPDSKINKEHFQWIKDRASYTPAHLETAKTIIDWFSKQDPKKNDYYHNISVIILNGYSNYRNIGLVVSMIPVYRKAMDLLNPKDTRVSNWVGQPGNKMDLTLTVKSIRTMESQFNYGYSRYGNPMVDIVNFIDKNGNRFTWFTSGKSVLDEGKTYTGKATIKKHNEYKGIKSTIITRYKAKEVYK